MFHIYSLNKYQLRYILSSSFSFHTIRKCIPQIKLYKNTTKLDKI